MIYNKNPLLKSITPSKLEDYIKYLGWGLTHKINDSTNVWRNDNMEILVPVSSFEHNERRLNEAIELLSIYKEESIESIIKEVAYNKTCKD